MTTYIARINEDHARTAEISYPWSQKPATVADDLIERENIREGATVRFANLTYDPTTDTFKPLEYSFAVENGKVVELKCI